MFVSTKVDSTTTDVESGSIRYTVDDVNVAPLRADAVPFAGNIAAPVDATMTRAIVTRRCPTPLARSQCLGLITQHHMWLYLFERTLS